MKIGNPALLMTIVTFIYMHISPFHQIAIHHTIMLVHNSQVHKKCLSKYNVQHTLNVSSFLTGLVFILHSMQYEQFHSTLIIPIQFQ